MSDDVIGFDEFDFSDNVLVHIGVARRSGRYPWGSGDNAYQNNKNFLSYVKELRDGGMSQTDIVKALEFKSTAELRARMSIATNQNKASDLARVRTFKEKQMSNVAIAERLGVSESKVRAMLKEAYQARSDVLEQTTKTLRDRITETGGFLDVGEGNQHYLGVSKEKLNTAVEVLKQEGYETYWVKVKQLGTGEFTNTKIVVPPGVDFSEVMANQDKIVTIGKYTEDGGHSFKTIRPPVHTDSSRIMVRYGKEGGADKDGVIELRREVEDLSLGNARYAQVRIGVDGTHYLKGMAMYGDKMPDGFDIVFNTNKENTGNKLDAMKTLKDDADLPFGSITRQKFYIGKDGKSKQSPLNIVGSDKDGADVIAGEEGAWATWSKKLSSQFLSKQPPSLAQQQLDLTYKAKKAEYDEIMALTNPVVKKKLLQEFADGADASAKHLKAAGLPRTANHVILPINSLKDNEVYAPNYNDGESVVLIRHPHGGIFEIPELRVNNRNREANRLIKGAKDAVGINSKVAKQLSGADFDGDTVLVIPNPKGRVRTRSPLAELKNFDPQQYKMSNGKKNGLSDKTKQTLMGDVSNLITDMTIKGANFSEIARAVKHSMVVIDAEKHNLDYKQSAIDNDIKSLKGRYQVKEDGSAGGAATLISRAKRDQRVPEYKPRPMSEGGPIDPATGQKVYVPTGRSYVDKRGRTQFNLTKSAMMDQTNDARTLTSKPGTVIEDVYADYANKMKAVANQARKAAISEKPSRMSESAKKTYAKEVQSLNDKLTIAKQNTPRERNAQLTANVIVDAKKKSTPDLTRGEIKKLETLALAEARARLGAKKQKITFEPQEWDAIQAGAISASKLSAMLDNADMDQVRSLATPRERKAMPPTKVRLAESMLARGYTQAEVASALGVPASTLNDAITNK